MDQEIDRLSTGTQIGDYLLNELLYDGTSIRTWKAHQVSINREVIIDSLNFERQSDEAAVSTFLSDVRAKAQVDHPLIGSVFEAVREGRLCFYARENLTGETLETLQNSATQLTPDEVAHTIRQIAEANLYLEERRITTLPILPEQILISEHGLTRQVNTAVGGIRDPNVATTDKHTIATALKKVLKPGCPGSTRTLSLLNYMADLEREIPLTWEQIQDLSEGVEQQLAEPVDPLPLENSTVRLNKRDNSKKLIMLAGIGIGAAIVITIGSLMLNRTERPKQRELTSMAQIPADNYTSHDGAQVALSEFWIDCHEVTIAEYALFLEAMEVLSRQQISIYQHEDQPESKRNHQPHDWEELYAAAINGAVWNGLEIDPNCPVIGVDWWDAYAYCNYKRRRLPTQEEWHATLLHSVGEGSLTPSPWGPVDQQSSDSTGNNIHGLAGNVAEWSSKMSKDPAFPTQPKMPLILGGSYQKKRSAATSREWLNQSQLKLEDARSLYRSDLGFRTVSSTAPTQ
jgi:hypothetical protein